MFLHRPARLRGDVRAVRPGPRHGAADPLPHPPGRRRGAARARLAGRSSRPPSHGEEQGRAFGLWAGASGRHDASWGRSWAACSCDTLSLAAGLLRQRARSWLIAAYATVRYVPGEPQRAGLAAASTGWARSTWRLAVGGLSFGAASTAGERRLVRTRWPSSSSASGSRRWSPSRSCMRRRPDPLVPLALFRSRNFTVTNISTLPDLRCPLRGRFYYLRALPSRARSATPPQAAGVAASPARCSWPSSRRGSGCPPRASGRAASWPRAH